jgi:hypothetical protein
MALRVGWWQFFYLATVESNPSGIKGLLFSSSCDGLRFGKPSAFESRRCLMSYKVMQLSPLSTRSTQVKILIQGPWSAPLAQSADARFLRSWMVYDSGIGGGPDAATTGFNWNALLGLVVVVGVSGSFWAGVGITLSHLL